MNRFQPLAAGLLERREAVLAAWMARVDEDPSLEDASRWSRQQFVDHLPDVIERFARSLVKGDANVDAAPDAAPLAEAHARHRWMQGFSLRAVVREWGHLNVCMVKALDELGETFGATPAHRRDVVQRWGTFLADQMSESAVRYQELQQAEALTRARELEEASIALRRLAVLRGQQLDSMTRTLRSDMSLVVTSATMLDDPNMTADDRAEFRRTFQSGFRSVDYTLRDLATLAQLEAGLRRRSSARFDAGLTMLGQCRHVAAQAEDQGAAVNCLGPEHFEVTGDERNVAALVDHLVQFVLRTTDGVHIELRWGAEASGDCWFFTVEHAAPAGIVGDPVAEQLVDATRAAGEVVSKTVAVSDDAIAGPAGAGGVKLSIAKRLCELLDASFEYGVADARAIYRITLPMG